MPRRSERCRARLPMIASPLPAVLLLLSAFPAACGSHVSSSRTQPLASFRSHALESGSAGAKIAGLRDRASAALSKAKAAQAIAESSALASEQVRMQALTTASELKDLSNQATAQADGAADASKETGNSLKAMEKAKQDTINLAGKLAVVRVKEMFLGKFKELASWRSSVLQDPHAKAAKEGPKAAEPYSRAFDTYYNQIQTYQAQARSMAHQSIEAHAEAGRIGDAAQDKVAIGDTIGSNQDLELARAMHAKGTNLADNAKALQASASEMNGMAGLYTWAAQVASERAAFQANPNRMPALHFDPNLAYAPPPPLR